MPCDAPRRPTWRPWLLALLCAAPACRADPGYYLSTPYDQAGQWGLELRYWTVKARGDDAYLWPELAVSYGFGSRWTSRLFANWVGERLQAQQLATLNWQNVILLTQGQRDYDLAVHTQLTHNVGGSNAVEGGLLWQTDLGRWRLNTNAIWRHDLQRHDTEFRLQARGLWHLAPGWRAGLVGYDEVGRWNHWPSLRRQSLRAGPALVADLADGSRGRLELQAAVLAGKTFGQRGTMFSAQLGWYQ